MKVPIPLLLIRRPENASQDMALVSGPVSPAGAPGPDPAISSTAPTSGMDPMPDAMDGEAQRLIWARYVAVATAMRRLLAGGDPDSTAPQVDGGY